MIEKVKAFCERNNISFEPEQFLNISSFVIDSYRCVIKDFKDLINDPFINTYKLNQIIVITNCSDKEGKNFFGAPNGKKSNGLRYLHKCPEPLIGIDFSLFDNPEFPYRDDRPKCFYDVHVSNEPTSFEAFQDETFRWNMIKNRIEYSGGYINNKQVLTAMNVTRKCKQPSWFSVPFAKHLIETYATTNIIVDPFAGWGARHDACKELGVTYVGCDLNEDLVEWHKSKGRNIELGDAEKFKYDGECTVLICPPYQDVETYFESQDLVTTQCQWLQTVMRNVPNAKEYIMTCKVVDEDFKDYVKEIKHNRSCFGDNQEKVIVITNEESKSLI